MKRRQKNVFVTRSASAISGPRSGLAGMLSPLRAALKESRSGHTLALSPMRLIDAVDIWPELTADSPAVTLLADVTPGGPGSRNNHLSMPETVKRLGISLLEEFGDRACVVDDGALRELASLMQSRQLLAVVVEGPIEAGDARAMVDAVMAGGSALEAEIRAKAALCAGPSRTMRMEVRDPLHAALLVAANFRHYLAALRNRPPEEFSRPQAWQIDRVLSLTGALTVRPIETEVFSTSVDVGINTDPEGRLRPADRSLIYDIVSRTWHDEP